MGMAASGNDMRLRHDVSAITRHWQTAGIWDNLHGVLLANLRNADRIDFSRVIAAGSSVCGLCTGEQKRPQPD